MEQIAAHTAKRERGQGGNMPPYETLRGSGFLVCMISAGVAWAGGRVSSLSLAWTANSRAEVPCKACR